MNQIEKIIDIATWNKMCIRDRDMLGMNNGFRPRFLRRYADLYTVMTDAISRYVSDVKDVYKRQEYGRQCKTEFRDIV